MLIKESLWIKEILLNFKFGEGTKFLNFGAQDEKYLKYQPYIKGNVYNPIISNNYKLINFDLKPGPGIDVYGDLRDPKVFEQLKSLNCECILLLNVLEHLNDIRTFVELLNTLMKPGSLILITVPYKYPYHEDPLDNLYRPKPSEIKEMFTECITVDEAIVIDYKYIYYLITNYRILAKFILRLLTPFYKYNRWKTNILPKLKYIFKNYEVSCILLEKK